MSHVLVKPTSGPEVGEVVDPVAGACVGQDLPRPARQRLGLIPDSAQTQPRLMRLSGTGGTRTLRPDGVVRAAVGDPPASTMSSCSRWIRPPPKCSVPVSAQRGSRSDRVHARRPRLGGPCRCHRRINMLILENS